MRISDWSSDVCSSDLPAYEHHLKTYGPQSKFGYKDFIPMFKAEKFDPAAWVKLFTDAGAKYVIPVAEHCDGFAMYDSDLTVWDAADLDRKSTRLTSSH